MTKEYHDYLVRRLVDLAKLGGGLTLPDSLSWMQPALDSLVSEYAKRSAQDKAADDSVYATSVVAKAVK